MNNCTICLSVLRNSKLISYKNILVPHRAKYTLLSIVSNTNKSMKCDQAFGCISGCIFSRNKSGITVDNVKNYETPKSVLKYEPTETDNNFKVLDVLQDLALDNVNFFRNDESEFGQRLFEAFRGIDCHVKDIRPKIDEVKQLAPNYDYDAKVPGNGYRSFLLIVHKAAMHTVEITQLLLLKRDKLIFRKGIFVREVESCNHLMASLLQCLEHLITLSKWCEPGELFPLGNYTPHDLLSTGDNINQYCFYGRCLGFQFCEGMRNILKFIILCMTSFSEVYYNRGNLLTKATSSMWFSGKYLMDPELRARRVVNISQHSSIEFCKAFWYLSESEVMQIVPKLTPSSQIAVNKVISIPPEPLEYVKPDGTTISIPVPSSHIPKAPIQVRLISSVSRAGMVGEGSSLQPVSTNPKSRGFLFHCHGGGFVSQSSLAHMVYLREWATQLNVPILSVDYSLAPEAPYPRALEEILYAYVWTLNNYQLLGTTAERIIFAGDSAGANLVTALALKCISLGLPLPNGMFLAYVPVAVNFWPTPARMLCLMDPLLPLGFMLRCIKAYTVPPKDKSSKRNSQSSSTDSFEEVTESDLAELQAHKSLASSDNNLSDTLTNVSLSSQQMGGISPASEWCKLNDTEGLNNVELTEKYVSEFNTLVTELDTEVDENSSSRDDDTSLKHKMNNLVGVITSTFNRLTNSISRNAPLPSNAERILDIDGPNMDVIKDEFSIDVPKDPFMSPYYASDDILKQLPPIRILTVQLDPCLDDCVTFGKKLKKLGNDIDLEILTGLPHGFLNFSLFSKEAQEGSKRCIEIIEKLMDLKSLEPPSPDKNDT